MIKLWGLKNCDSCRRALKWLADNNMVVEFIDIRSDALSRDHLNRFVTSLGSNHLLNRRSTTWRCLSALEKAQAETDLSFLLEHPTVIKRPVIEIQGTILIGFDTTTQAKIIKAI